MSKETCLVTRFLDNEWWNISKKDFCQSISETPTGRRKRKKSNCIGFCVTRKRNELLKINNFLPRKLLFYITLDKCLKVKVHKMFGRKILRNTTEWIILNFYHSICKLSPSNIVTRSWQRQQIISLGYCIHYIKLKIERS